MSHESFHVIEARRHSTTNIFLEDADGAPMFERAFLIPLFPYEHLLAIVFLFMEIRLYNFHLLNLPLVVPGGY